MTLWMNLLLGQVRTDLLTNYGIYFKTQYVAITTARRRDVLNKLIESKELLRSFSSQEEVMDYVNKSFDDYEERYAASIIVAIISKAHDSCEMLTLAQSYFAFYERSQALADLYSYRIRSCFLSNNESIKAHYSVNGSDESGCVIVKEVLHNS